MQPSPQPPGRRSALEAGRFVSAGAGPSHPGEAPGAWQLLGFLGLSHGWTWAFWGLASSMGDSVWDWPGVAFFYVGATGILRAGLVMTAVAGGCNALSDLWMRVLDPRRVRSRWWVVILLPDPAVALASSGIAAQVGG